MAPNKKEKHSKRIEKGRKIPAASTAEQTKPELDIIQTETITGNEERDKDIFIDMEPELSVQPLLVTDSPQTTPPDHEQQVEVKNSDSSNDDVVLTISPPSQDAVTPTPNSSNPVPNDEIEDEQSLSASVTRLTTPNGAEIILIGTAHFSKKSVQDVQKVIKSVKPSSVVLELCRERAFMLSLDEQSLLEQSRTISMEKVRNAIADKGLAQGLVFIMFIKMSASLTEKLGMAPGAEFRAASAEAQKIPGCRVVLADRALGTTIARAVASVSLWQKMRLVYHVLTSDINITQEDVESCKDKDMLESLLEELGGQFPGFKRVLLDERNIYLAHTIYRWAQNSETSFGPQRLVAVVGIGHVAGIVENWGKTTEEQMRSLDIIPKTSKTKKIVTKSIKYCALALLIYVGYRAVTPSSIQQAIRDRVWG